MKRAAPKMIRRIDFYDTESTRSKGKVGGWKVLAAAAIGVVATLAMAAPAFAAFDTYTGSASTPVTSTHASTNACFGQGRSYYAQGGPNGVLSPYTNGYWISQRAGNNPSINDAYADDCGSPAGN
ncbi:MAG: hypothetical protein HKL81_10350 [Acidimicrobiaceae bacterium]|nr:hypothetical protein [Acidimicrobiaceae bacterium]